MSHLTHTLVFFLHVIYSEASDIIQTQDTVRANVGDEARFTCQLMRSKNVLQVTWQRIIPGETQDVASYNKRFGTKINHPFQGKVEFVETGLQNSSIVLRNVTKEDKSCFRCLFNAYPEGAIYEKTCLIVNEPPEPILRITKPNGTEPMVVFCSAVSDPGLMVTLEVPGHVGPSNYTSIHTANADGTVTVTSTVTLERFCSNITQVRCVACSYAGLAKEVSHVIYSGKQGVCDKSEADQNGFSYWLLSMLVLVVLQSSQFD